MCIRVARVMTLKKEKRPHSHVARVKFTWVQTQGVHTDILYTYTYFCICIWVARVMNLEKDKIHTVQEINLSRFLSLSSSLSLSLFLSLSPSLSLSLTCSHRRTHTLLECKANAYTHIFTYIHIYMYIYADRCVWVARVMTLEKKASLGAKNVLLLHEVIFLFSNVITRATHTHMSEYIYISWKKKITSCKRCTPLARSDFFFPTSWLGLLIHICLNTCTYIHSFQKQITSCKKWPLICAKAICTNK